jgi:hypothetical protein
MDIPDPEAMAYEYEVLWEDRERLRAALIATKRVLIRERMDGLLSEPDDHELMDVINDALHLEK